MICFLSIIEHLIDSVTFSAPHPQYFLIMVVETQLPLISFFLSTSQTDINVYLCMGHLPFDLKKYLLVGEIKILKKANH